MEDKAICLDTTDWKILEALQKNARSTFTEIGQSVGLTAPAVRERDVYKRQGKAVRVVAGHIRSKIAALPLIFNDEVL